MEEETLVAIRLLKIDYFCAHRYWVANDLSYCAKILEKLAINFNKLIINQTIADNHQVKELKQLIWHLKIKCITDQNYIDEPLLLNDDEVEGKEDQIKVLTRPHRNSSLASYSTDRPKTGFDKSVVSMTERIHTTTSRPSTGTHVFSSRRRSGAITGRMSSLNSSRGATALGTSYRPLTTSLNESQTAFSRSTRSLLKFANNRMLAKIMFSYLYNVQVSSSKCPDFRQCLEFLYLAYQSRLDELSNETKNIGNITGQEARSQQEETMSRANRRGKSIRIKEMATDFDYFWLCSYGKCYYNLNMLRLSEENFLNCVKKEPMFVEAYAWLIKIYLSRNELIRMLEICNQGVERTKSSILQNWLSRIQTILGMHQQAYLTSTKLLLIDPTNFEALANVGYYCFYSGKYEEALKCFERIDMLCGSSTTSLFDTMTELGNELNETNMLASIEQQTLIEMANVAASNSSSQTISVELLNNLALCYLYSGQYHLVIPLLQKALNNTKSQLEASDIWYNMSFVCVNCGCLQLAIECLNLSIKFNSQNQEAVNNLGVLKYKSLIEGYNNQVHFQNRLELSSYNMSLNNNNDNIQSEHKHECENETQTEYIEKDKLLEQAESYFNPFNPNANSDKDIYMSDMSQYLFDSCEPEMLFNMALVKEQRGQLYQALSYLKAYLQFEPNNWQALKMIKEIKGIIQNDAH